jgi:hypothetical protein
MNCHIRRILTRPAAALCLAAMLPAVASALPIINEFVANHDATDTMEFVEVFGTPNTDYSSFSILQLEGDAVPSTTGTVDTIHPVGTTDALGLWVSDPINNVIENGTITLLLVQGFTGAMGTDLDTNDDGTLDSMPWTSLVDSIGVTDAGAGDRNYSSVVLSPSFDGGTLTPGGASRIPNGVDTDTLLDWRRNNFNRNNSSPVFGQAANTPGALNSLQVPEPSGILLLVCAATACFGAGRRVIR